RPFLLAKAQLHYVSTKSDLDYWENLHWLTPLEDPVAWRSGEAIAPPALEEGPADGVGFAPTPSLSSWEKTTTQWKRSLAAFLYRVQRLEQFSVPEIELYSRPHESAADFRLRCAHARREKRDEEIERLRQRFAPKLARVEEAVLRAEALLERESSQYGDSKLETAMDFGATLAGALFGRKLGNVTRARRTARSASRVARERKDVGRARAKVEMQKEKLEALEAELIEKTAELQTAYSEEGLQVTSVLHAPRKSDVIVERIALAWRR
ncbi:MAG TPA: hypothetical protein VEK15_00830, partial [Vicinamibacteria bacterium]|nr:hypothetical protein [Vicinamibacteria bacterium]